ncbi:MAG: DNA-binding protein [Clostridia bacterium]|nr:DNA-binding protein [Clostridia bacterium]
MFEKNLKLAYLLDFYGEVLDEHTRSVMKAYYDDDLSLSEIAEGVGISRQGVRHVIKKGEEQLSFLEERLGLAAHNEELERALTLIDSIRKSLESDTLDKAVAMATLDEIKDIIVTR